MKMKRCPNPKCDSSEDSLEILEDERCTRNRCCWVHCGWCGVSGPTAGPSDESAIEAWDMLPRITEENYAALAALGGTTISVEQAQEASRLGSQAAAVHTVRACAQWLRINGWHNSVRDTAIEMERLMVEDVNRAYGTP